MCERLKKSIFHENKNKNAKQTHASRIEKTKKNEINIKCLISTHGWCSFCWHPQLFFIDIYYDDDYHTRRGICQAGWFKLRFIELEISSGASCVHRSFRETRSDNNNKQTCKLKMFSINLYFYYRFPSSSSSSSAWLYLKFKFVIKLNQKNYPYGE